MRNFILGILFSVLAFFILTPLIPTDSENVFLELFPQQKCKVCPIEGVDMSLFWETWEVLKEKYVDTENFDEQEMVYGAIAGMVNSLDDPYTIFMDPEETKLFKSDVEGSFEGVGMEIGIRDKQLTVIAPLEGTPAQEAGIITGDIILKIDGVSAVDMSTDNAVKLIRGKKGTNVVLTIYRDSWENSKEITITRGVIEIPSLKLEITDDNIAHLSLYQFSRTAKSDFKDAVQQIIDSPADSIILDLRNNPGGYLDVAQNIAGWFLNNGDIVAIEDFGGEKESNIYKAEGSPRLINYPIVVLINGGSASAAEILAGCLRDNRNIQLIGETSFGKGSVQELQDLTGKTSLKVTVAKWLTPNGTSISEVGLSPDIEVEITLEDYTNKKDPQLDRAVEILEKIK